MVFFKIYLIGKHLFIFYIFYKGPETPCSSGVLGCKDGFGRCKDGNLGGKSVFLHSCK